MIRLLLPFLLLVAFANGCAEEVTPAVIGQFESAISQEDLGVLVTDLRELARSRGFLVKGAASADELENRDVLFLNFYNEGDIVLTVHDLKEGRVSYYLYDQSFRSPTDYEKFVEDLDHVFDKNELRISE